MAHHTCTLASTATPKKNNQLSVAWCKYWIEWPTIGVYKVSQSL